MNDRVGGIGSVPTYPVDTGAAHGASEGSRKRRRTDDHAHSTAAEHSAAPAPLKERAPVRKTSGSLEQKVIEEGRKADAEAGLAMEEGMRNAESATLREIQMKNRMSNLRTLASLAEAAANINKKTAESIARMAG